MPTQFECTTSYLGKDITVKSDSFEQLHQAISRLDELNRDANFLAKKTGTKNIAPSYRTDDDDYEYYGVTVRGEGFQPNVTFGKLQKGGLVPFFPKGQEGYRDPNDPPQRSNGQRGSQQRGGGQRQQQAPQQQRQQAPPAQQSPRGPQPQSQDNFAAKQQQDDLPF